MPSVGQRGTVALFQMRQMIFRCAVAPCFWVNAGRPRIVSPGRAGRTACVFLGKRPKAAASVPGGAMIFPAVPGVSAFPGRLPEHPAGVYR